jgi:hypothetical protein
MRVQQRQNAQQYYRTSTPSQTPGQAARGTYRAGRKGARKVTRRGASYGPKHLLTAELIAGMVIVLVRLVADYEPQSDGTVKGKIGHPSGQYGPVPIAAGMIATFWVLSFFVAKGGRWATVANAGGALVVVTLGVKSSAEIQAVADTFGSWGKARKPPGDWQTTGDPAGDVIVASDGTVTGGSGSSASAGNGLPGSGVIKNDIIDPLLNTLNPVDWIDGTNYQGYKSAVEGFVDKIKNLF